MSGAESKMKKFSVSREILDYPITADVTILHEGIHVLICGGVKTHIGAVSIVNPEGEQTDTEFPTHKDGVIARKWAAALAAKGVLPITVVAGIHYDNISKEQILEIVSVCDEMLEEILGRV